MNSKTIAIAVSLASVLSLGIAGPASAGPNAAYLRLAVDGAAVDGCVTLEGRIGTFEVNAFGHSLTQEQDAASGVPTGRRQHKPVTIRMDASCGGSVAVYNAMVNNENVTEWELSFWRPSQAGKEEQFYTIVLEDARVVGISSSGGATLSVELIVAFSYRTITWNHLDSGDSVSDDWTAE